MDRVTLLGAVDPWRFQPHPEVWFLVGSVVVLAFYATRVIGPKMVPEGGPVVSAAQKRWFAAGVVVLWLASDWPMHDISEEYLYSVHMVQHLLLAFVLPPLMLLATPEWLARLLVDGDGRFGRFMRTMSRPLLAGLMYNAVFALLHWPDLVNLTVENGPAHYLAHLVVVTAAFLMWMPVCGPIREWRLSLPAQVAYLFVMSIIPTVPSAWLIFATDTVYTAYDHGDRLWDITVISDQQAAGTIMKLIGGLYLWTIITFLFFKWALRHEDADRRGLRPTEREILTWDEVKAELDAAPPAPAEPTLDG